ncbi:MAG: DUF6027 family protein [Nitriliruptorales bacterium]|nr:DUF6027 family protein [Nitriliruptorales bacterium]
MSGRIDLEPYTDSWPEDDPDAAFRADVAAYSLQDPLSTLEAMSRNLDIPVGALAGYVLARWAAGGAEGLLELGPSAVDRMTSVINEAEEAGTDAARLAAYETLRAMVSWLRAGLDDAETTYPSGGDHG